MTDGSVGSNGARVVDVVTAAVVVVATDVEVVSGTTVVAGASVVVGVDRAVVVESVASVSDPLEHPPMINTNTMTTETRMRFIDPPIGLPTSTLRFEHPDLQRPSHFTERPTDADASVKYSRLASDVRERISGNMYGSVGRAYVPLWAA